VIGGVDVPANVSCGCLFCKSKPPSTSARRAERTHKRAPGQERNRENNQVAEPARTSRDDKGAPRMRISSMRGMMPLCECVKKAGAIYCGRLRGLTKGRYGDMRPRRGARSWSVSSQARSGRGRLVLAIRPSLSYAEAWWTPRATGAARGLYSRRRQGARGGGGGRGATGNGGRPPMEREAGARDGGPQARSIQPPARAQPQSQPPFPVRIKTPCSPGFTPSARATCANAKGQSPTRDGRACRPQPQGL